MGTSGKICIRCGEDCSGRARTKDSHGRYMCNECFTSARGARSAPAPVDSPPDEAVPFADDPAGILAAVAEQPTPCPGCGLLLSHGTVLCTRCGHNTRTGRAVSTVTTVEGPEGPRPAAAGAVRKCVKCGYDLSGLKVPRCPECGTYSGREERRRAAEARASAAIRRNEYAKPIVVFLVGMSLTVAVLSALGVDARVTLTVFLVKDAIFVPLGLVIYFMCCVMWLGFDAPFHLNALRLAAAFAVTDVVMVFAAFFGIAGWVMVLATMAICLHQLMDHDMPDAVLVSFFLIVAQFALVLTLRAQMD